jgi:DNA (cytosine-5)-methyltransferase 1
MEYDGFKELSPTLKARDYKDPKWVYTPHTDVGVVVVANTDSKHEHSGRVYSDNGLSPTIMSNSHGKTSGGYTSPKVLEQNLQIRKLTPRETWRLMGFDDSDFDKASAIHSNSTLYKQAGNSIVVNVLEHILKGLFYEPNTV